MSDWSNLEDIMQDLSLAQGHAVPSRLETVAGAPPPIHEPDEGSVERSYYESHCVGGGDFAPPDYKQIQMMLDLVKIDEEDNDPVNSSELDSLAPEFVPGPKEKIKINVALSSIKAAKEAELAARGPLPKDVIPTMFKKKSLSLTEVRKENALPSQTSPPERPKQYTPSANANVYYSKYLKKEKVLSSQTSPPERTKQYTPSANANFYYSKYLKKSMLKEQIAEDIWAKAEKQMKEIEARQRLIKAEPSPEERGNTSVPDVAHVAGDVMLAEHRHLLSDECMVCIVAAKHGYYF